MFLSLPLTAMLKVILDRVPALEPFDYLLGAGDKKEARGAVGSSSWGRLQWVLILAGAPYPSMQYDRPQD